MLALEKNQQVHKVSLIDVAAELNIKPEDIYQYFQDIEEVILNEQIYINKKIENYLTKGLKISKVPDDYKQLLEGCLDLYIEILPDYANAALAASYYLPECLEERKRAKNFYMGFLRQAIRKGWPGKVKNVVDRQAELVLITIYGLYEAVSDKNISERKKITADVKNMINLHLQDRLFF